MGLALERESGWLLLLGLGLAFGLSSNKRYAALLRLAVSGAVPVDESNTSPCPSMSAPLECRVGRRNEGEGRKPKFSGKSTNTG